jgi:excisionase family DNA binding protein
MAIQLERPTSQDGDSDDVGRSLLDELMTSSQVAALLQMRLSTVESYARRGLLPSVKVGRHRRFVRSQLERTIETLTNGDQPTSRHSPTTPNRDHAAPSPASRSSICIASGRP